jgi:hypothetical protein
MQPPLHPFRQDTAARTETDRQPLSIEEEINRARRRRKFLTRTLVGAPVGLLVAGHPIKTLSATFTGYCSYSGWHSFTLATSGAPKGSCSGGFLPSHYSSSSNWPNSVRGSSGSVSLSFWSTTFDAVFGTDTIGNLGTTKLKDIFGSDASSNEAVFAAALFNTQQAPGYPFIGSDIQSFYSGLTGSTYLDVISFLKQLNANA